MYHDEHPRDEQAPTTKQQNRPAQSYSQRNAAQFHDATVDHQPTQRANESPPTQCPAAWATKRGVQRRDLQCPSDATASRAMLSQRPLHWPSNRRQPWRRCPELAAAVVCRATIVHHAMPEDPWIYHRRRKPWMRQRGDRAARRADDSPRRTRSEHSNRNSPIRKMRNPFATCTTLYNSHADTSGEPPHLTDQAESLPSVQNHMSSCSHECEPISLRADVRASETGSPSLSHRKPTTACKNTKSCGSISNAAPQQNQQAAMLP